jgi:hypothetical protein
VTTPPTALSVEQLGRLFLDGVIQHFDDNGVELPDRRFIAPGNPQLIAWDCEQLYVALTGIGIGAAPDMPVQSPRQGAPVSALNIRHAIFSIQLVRCTPTTSDDDAGFPKAEDIDAAGGRSFRDAGLLSDAVVLMCSQLSKQLPPGSTVQAGLTSSLGPEGGFHANEATVAVTAMRLV